MAQINFAFFLITLSVGCATRTDPGVPAAAGSPSGRHVVDASPDNPAATSAAPRQSAWSNPEGDWPFGLSVQVAVVGAALISDDARTLQSVRRGLRQCFLRATETNPDFEGALIVHLAVEPGGKLGNLRAAPPPLAESALGTCGHPERGLCTEKTLGACVDSAFRQLSFAARSAAWTTDLKIDFENAH